MALDCIPFSGRISEPTTCGNTAPALTTTTFPWRTPVMATEKVDAQSGRVKSDRKRGTDHHSFKHGLCHLSEYRAWQCMRLRCLNPDNDAFADYGGRGITVCAGWKDNFLTFLSDMGRKPTSRHEIDRKDNNGHYSCGHCQECIANGWPANCRWATRSLNCRNRRTSVWVEFRNERRNLVDLLEEFGMSRSTVVKRLAKGWSVEAAITTPARAKKKTKQPCPALTDGILAEIRRRHQGGDSMTAIARAVGLSRSYVSRVARRPSE